METLLKVENARKLAGPIFWEELDWLAKIASDSTIAIELGSLVGKSSRVIADNLPENGLLYCIDTWKGSVEVPGEISYALLQEGDRTYIEFLENMWDHINSGKVIPLRMQGKNAAQFLFNKDIKCDFIFIDAGHGPGETKEDALNLLPLLKQTGIISGHDFNSPEGLWLDVAKEVKELFGDKIKNPPKTTIWYVEEPQVQ